MALSPLARSFRSPACSAQQQAPRPISAHHQPCACSCVSGQVAPAVLSTPGVPVGSTAPIAAVACAPTTTVAPSVVMSASQAASPIAVMATPQAAVSPVKTTASPASGTANGLEPAPGSAAALALLAAVGITPRAVTGAALAADDQRFSPVAIAHITHRLVEVKQLLDQLSAEQKELHETLRLAHLRGDLLHLVPPGQEPGTYQLPEGPTLHRRQGRKQWHYSEAAGELEAQLKARQVYEQAAGLATTSIGASFWELRFPKG